jgi:transposase InsO family protein
VAGCSRRAVCWALQIKPGFIKPRCPWTNGKAERFNRTLQNEWAYAAAWLSNVDRYNTRRGHSAAGGRPPITRLARTSTVNDVPGADS